MIRLPDLLAATLVAAGPGYMPERASSVADGVDLVFNLLFWVSAFFLAVIVVMTAVFVVRYRARPGRTGPEASPDHSTRLELVWTVIPLAIVLGLFALSTQVYLSMLDNPEGKDAQRVHVTAKKWSWWFDHDGGRGSKELHLVQGRTVVLTLASTDVIHSFYVPEFRVKMDAVPGRFNRLVITPTKAGTYPVLCTEYCGTNHSTMTSVTVVHPDQASYDAWMKEGQGREETLLQVGVRVFDEKGCSACHSVDGTAGIGPSLKGLWGRDEKLVGGGTVKVDENYVRESIVKPGAKIVAGYDDMMPPSPLEEREIQGIIAYMQSLKEGT
ncbi:MAG TPA: cytochrome c oxidase subunit II [Anaeromyxobacteraceae bacterium]|nr:cytochrome c oxidase subunit II [Anaeromyxobacteraceae bacterium]